MIVLWRSLVTIVLTIKINSTQIIIYFLTPKYLHSLLLALNKKLTNTKINLKIKQKIELLKENSLKFKMIIKAKNLMDNNNTPRITKKKSKMIKMFQIMTNYGSLLYYQENHLLAILQICRSMRRSTQTNLYSLDIGLIIKGYLTSFPPYSNGTMKP